MAKYIIQGYKLQISHIQKSGCRSLRNLTLLENKESID